MAVRTAAIIYSRLSSSRLPNKALLNLGESTVIENVILSAKHLKVDLLILATSTERSDDLLVNILSLDKNVIVFRGSLTDVSNRTLKCIKKYKIDFFVRLNGDSPIIPIKLINEQLTKIKKSTINDFDIISNVITRSFPYGYSVEIINSRSFIKYYKFFSESEKEHITSFFYNNLAKIKYISLVSKDDLSKYSLTIDDPNTYFRMYKVFKQKLKSNINVKQILKK